MDISESSTSSPAAGIIEDAVDDLLDVLAGLARSHQGRSAGVRAAREAVRLFLAGLEGSGGPSLSVGRCPSRSLFLQHGLSPVDVVCALVIFRLSTCQVVSRRVLVAVGDPVCGAPRQDSVIAILSGGGRDLDVAARFQPDAPLFTSGFVAYMDEQPAAGGPRLSLTPSGVDFITGTASETERTAGRRLPDVSGCGAAFVQESLRLDDLVLDEVTRNKLKSICNAVVNLETVYEKWGYARLVPHGRSNTALFSGPPGTGKTVCASAIAAEVGKPLLRVDLSSIFSKWVGETEKNLKKVFDCASSVDAVLLFDEADAVFSKRGESNGASDKYANLQSGYLLQRLEAFDKTVILTSNLPENIDPAFMRRIRFKVEFGLPDAALRRRMWVRMLASPVPTDADVQSAIDDLAERWDFSPALISNTCLRAAFEAAAKSTVVTGEMLHEAAFQEASEGGILVRATRSCQMV